MQPHPTGLHPDYLMISILLNWHRLSDRLGNIEPETLERPRNLPGN